MTRKIVISPTTAGFRLSEPAMRQYVERKGLTLYEETSPGAQSWWVTPPGNRSAPPGFAGPQPMWTYNIPRDDADLVAVVEALGEGLTVVEIPGDAVWWIDGVWGSERVVLGGGYGQ